ncbi:MAG: hypothetical protein J5856_09815 [Lachnospiraceae bacterium]|nr:hypothetical protein [Lachnospiraceae bacterium]
MEIRKQTLKEKKHINRGSTMVETLVSFTVLFIVLASLYAIVTFSTELYMRSVDLSRQQQSFYKEINKKPDKMKNIIASDYSAGFGNNRAGVALKLEIDPVTFEGKDEMKDSFISMKNTSLTSYVYKDDKAKEEGRAVPKAVNFRYVK